MMVLLSFTVITIGSKDVPVLGSVRGAVIDVLGPVGRGFKSATKPVRSWWGGVNDYDRIAAENDQLRDEVERLKAKQAANSSAAAELARLKELEGLPFIADIDSKVALISTGAYSSFDDNTMTIDRGATSGFKVGMPVDVHVEELAGSTFKGKLSLISPSSGTRSVLRESPYLVFRSSSSSLIRP